MSKSRRALFVALTLLAIAGAIAVSLAVRLNPYVRAHVVDALNQRFDTEVALDGFQVDVFPRPALRGSGLTVRVDGRTDVPPLLKIGSFEAAAALPQLLASPVRIRTVELEHMQIHVPAGGIRHDDAPASDGSSNVAPSGAEPVSLIADEIIAHAARLEIASRKPGKLPRVFDIHDLHIWEVGGRDGSTFQAVLTNPLPEGRVTTRGRFGPWQRRDLRTTPLSGEYRFDEANLDTIKGLGGVLSSHGSYAGVLDRIEVEGETKTPDFSIDIAGRPVPLTTRFQAVVDGTNGDTWLNQVDATILESHIRAKGAVVRAQDVKGRHVALDVVIDRARIEDLLTLAVKSGTSPLTGAVTATTKFFLPAGEADVVRKLHLTGTFALDEARFTNVDVQRRISELSQRGRGDETPEAGERVVSKLRGNFELKDASLRFSSLTFSVPGAAVQLAGRYHLEAETLDFSGHLLLDASLRDTTSGVKAVLATLAQPFFRRRGGGSRLPIRVGGTRAKPVFGVDVKRAFFRG